MQLSWLVLPLIVALWAGSMKVYREHVSRNLSRVAARPLHLHGYVLKTFGSWSKGTDATAFLTDESLFLRTGPGGVQIDRKGTRPARIGISLFGSRCFADKLSTENDHLRISFSGFVSGTLTISGLPGDERDSIVRALTSSAG